MSREAEQAPGESSTNQAGQGAPDNQQGMWVLNRLWDNMGIGIS